jgi:hypothetical protein
VKITSLSVTDENGAIHVWEGEGYVTPERSQNYRNQPLVIGVTAHINMHAKGKTP